jgi:endonuclease YncB( thermonuclease family)
MASLLLAAACGCHRKEEPPLGGSLPPGPQVAERVKVLNADVLIVDGKHIRLAGAITPQPIPDARCWAEALAAKQATAVVREMMKLARTIRVEPTGRTDEYNRSISRVFLDNQSLTAALHDQGMAAEAEGRAFSWCAPISEGGEGAPDVKSLMDFSRG